MEREIVYKDDHLLLEFIPEGNYLHETWWGLTSSTKFQKLLEIIIQSLENKQADGLILDAREHYGLLPQDQERAAKLHDDYAKKHGILKQAIIVPKDIYSNYSVTSYSEKFEGKVYSTIKFFTDIPSAEKWLQSK